MTKNEIIERNITLTFDFLRQLVSSPEILDDIHHEALIEFVEKDRSLLEPSSYQKPDKYFSVKHHFDSTMAPKIK